MVASSDQPTARAADSGLLPPELSISSILRERRGQLTPHEAHPPPDDSQVRPPVSSGPLETLVILSLRRIRYSDARHEKRILRLRSQARFAQDDISLRRIRNSDADHRKRILRSYLPQDDTSPPHENVGIAAAAGAFHGHWRGSWDPW